ESDVGRAFLASCHRLGLEVEYELHALGDLVPRDLFAKDATLFRQNEKGERTPDANLCVQSKAALEIAAENAAKLAKRLRRTTGPYFFWGDDAQPWCRCPKCAALTDSDQALVVENRLLAAIRGVDSRARVAHLAYANTTAPPKLVKPSNGVFLEFAPYDRRTFEPLTARDVPENARALEALDANLAVFGAENAQCLEYWLDVSRVSGYAKPPKKLPFAERALAADVAGYGSRQIRHVTTFAAWIDADYVVRYGEPPLEAYGRALAAYNP